MTRATQDPLEVDDMQGLVVRGYGNLPFAAFLLGEIVEVGAAARLLQRWAGTMTTGTSPGPSDRAVNVALTAPGVERLTAGRTPAGFSEQFTSGMASDYRSRLLGDVGDDAPAGWRWGGPGPGSPPVHVLVMMYAVTPAELDLVVTATASDAEANGLRTVARLETRELQLQEPFGFHDGISQPLMEGLPKATSGGDVVRAGEFVLGYVNEYGQRTERPMVPAAADPDRLLPRDADGSGAADVGRNGTYLVVRQLEQHVDAFWAYVAQATRGPDGAVDEARRMHLAAKMVGRWPSGAPLVLDPDADNPEHSNANDFTYHATDPQGLACPVGAHVRRANPRDSLEPGPGTPASVAVNHKHRVVRRGRGYGDPAADGGFAGVERGLHFMCINANIARQYEFIQHSWVNDPYFDLLDDSSDPLVGPLYAGGATFAVPALPVRKRYLDVPRFVRVRGGAYFFLPGIRALRYLASLADGAVSRGGEST